MVDSKSSAESHGSKPRFSYGGGSGSRSIGECELAIERLRNPGRCTRHLRPPTGPRNEQASRLAETHHAAPPRLFWDTSERKRARRDQPRRRDEWCRREPETSASCRRYFKDPLGWATRRSPDAAAGRGFTVDAVRRPGTEVVDMPLDVKDAGAEHLHVHLGRLPAGVSQRCIAEYSRSKVRRPSSDAVAQTSTRTRS